MRRFSFADPSFQAAFKAFLDERRGSPADVDAAVAEVLEAVRTKGLEALLDYARKFDKVELTAETIRVTAEEIEQGAADTPADVREAIAFAAARIRAYHSRQRPVDQAWTYTATRNGLQVVSSTRVSRASDDDSSDDSFHAAEVKWRNYLTGTPGAASAFVLRAVNGATGEICTWSTTR